MIKVFTLNKNGKIELTKKELEQLLNESYWEGYKNNSNFYWTYTSPTINTNPYITYSTGDTTFTYSTGDTTCNPYTIKTHDLTANSITIKSNLGD